MQYDFGLFKSIKDAIKDINEVNGIYANVPQGIIPPYLKFGISKIDLDNPNALRRANIRFFIQVFTEKNDEHKTTLILYKINEILDGSNLSLEKGYCNLKKLEIHNTFAQNRFHYSEVNYEAYINFLYN